MKTRTILGAIIILLILAGGGLSYMLLQTANEMSMKNCSIQVTGGSYYYKGGNVLADVKVKYKDKILREGKDYSLAYQNCDRPGTATVEVNGTGAFKGRDTVNYEIKVKEVRNISNVILENGSVETTFEPDPEYTDSFEVEYYKGTELVDTVDCQTGYCNDFKPSEAGTYQVVVFSIKDGYKSDRATGSVTFDNMAECSVIPDHHTYVYTGKLRKPAVIVKSGEFILTEGVDYILRYKGDFRNVGTVKITAKGIGKYRGLANSSYDIIVGKANNVKLTYSSKNRTFKVTYSNAYSKKTYPKIAKNIKYKVRIMRTTSSGRAVELKSATTRSLSCKTSRQPIVKNGKIRGGDYYAEIVTVMKKGAKTYESPVTTSNDIFRKYNQIITTKYIPRVKYISDSEYEGEITFDIMPKRMDADNGGDLYEGRSGSLYRIREIKEDANFTYSSSNKKVETVNANGKVTIKGTGETVITVKTPETDLYESAEIKIPLTVKSIDNSKRQDSRGIMGQATGSFRYGCDREGKMSSIAGDKDGNEVAMRSYVYYDSSEKKASDIQETTRLANGTKLRKGTSFKHLTHYHWTVVIRCKDPEKANALAAHVEAGCENEKIGYSQDRNNGNLKLWSEVADVETHFNAFGKATDSKTIKVKKTKMSSIGKRCDTRCSDIIRSALRMEGVYDIGYDDYHSTISTQWKSGTYSRNFTEAIEKYNKEVSDDFEIYVIADGRAGMTEKGIAYKNVLKRGDILVAEKNVYRDSKKQGMNIKQYLNKKASDDQCYVPGYHMAVVL